MKEQALLVVSEYGFQEACVFSKVKEEFGGFSNMSNALKVRINGILMKNTEVLYQVCRFPHLIAVQQDIIDQLDGMASKMTSRIGFKQQRE